MALDSALGAAVQGGFAVLGAPSQASGRSTAAGRDGPRGGLSWLDNDGVNLASSAAAALAAGRRLALAVPLNRPEPHDRRA